MWTKWVGKTIYDPISSRSIALKNCKKSPFLFPCSNSPGIFSKKYLGAAGAMVPEIFPPLSPL